MKRLFTISIHFFYWFLYLLLITSFLLAMPNGFKPFSFWGLGKVLFFSVLSLRVVISAVIGFYVAYFILFKKYLQRQTVIPIFIMGVSGALIISIALVFISNYWLVRKSIPVASGFDLMGEIIFMAMLILLHASIGFIIRGFINWYDDIKLKEALAQKNHAMELALVRAQLNPHFLFNTINNIDVLILKDAEKASACLNQLSDILRFMLYETQTETITLQQELAYIEKYIQLQKIRSSQENYVLFDCTGVTKGKSIAPMLLIPFIENAFKYASPNLGEPAIKIEINLNNNTLFFTCENYYQAQQSMQTSGGLGLELIQKRLKLLYPQHQLQISVQNNVYQVKLQVNLNGD